MGHIKRLIEKRVPGIYVRSLMIGNNIIAVSITEVIRLNLLTLGLLIGLFNICTLLLRFLKLALKFCRLE